MFITREDFESFSWVIFFFKLDGMWYRLRVKNYIYIYIYSVPNEKGGKGENLERLSFTACAGGFAQILVPVPVMKLINLLKGSNLFQDFSFSHAFHWLKEIHASYYINYLLLALVYLLQLFSYMWKELAWFI